MTPRLRYSSVRELLANPARWTQGPFARDASGTAVSPGTDEACSFCLVGAVYRVYGNMDLHTLIPHLPAGMTVPEFNDTKGRTHAEVLDLVVKAGI